MNDTLNLESCAGVVERCCEPDQTNPAHTSPQEQSNPQSPQVVTDNRQSGDASPDICSIAESIVGKVAWTSRTEGYCECPGKRMHTTNDGRKDCKLYLDAVPTLSCFHGNCKSALETANKQLRKAVAEGSFAPVNARSAREEKERLAEYQRKENIRKRAAGSKALILKKHRWTYDQINLESPVKLHENIHEHWHLLLGCFSSKDVVWIGDKFHSGKPEHEKHFRTVEEWRRENVIPGPYVCSSTFKPGVFSRTNENVLERRFLVVESDVLGRDEVGAIFRWLQKQVGLKLRAIVDTAGKSLHAWFDYPPEDVVEELKFILPELGCDPKLFTASQPVRLPGALRDTRFQKLVYLDGEVVQ
jgi:hypothetical protein